MVSLSGVHSGVTGSGGQVLTVDSTQAPCNVVSSVGTSTKLATIMMTRNLFSDALKDCFVSIVRELNVECSEPLCLMLFYAIPS